MTEKELDVTDVDTFYATEVAQLPTIKCPSCGSSITSLHKLLAEGKCKNCGQDISLKVEW